MFNLSRKLAAASFIVAVLGSPVFACDSGHKAAKAWYEGGSESYEPPYANTGDFYGKSNPVERPDSRSDANRTMLAAGGRLKIERTNPFPENTAS